MPVADQHSGEANVSRYPMPRIVGVLDDDPDVATVFDRLAALDITSGTVVLTSEDGIRLETSGEGHGALGRLLRVLQLTAQEGNARSRQGARRGRERRGGRGIDR